MADTPSTIPIIRTRPLERLEFAMDNTMRTAGLCIVKGPVGIGKSYALRELARTFTEQGFDVMLNTARPETEGALRAFVNDILYPYGNHGRSELAVQALATLLLRRPQYSGWVPPLLIVDESQGLKINILEMLRGIYDRGDAWRSGDQHAPAFGLMLVGNATFLHKTGSVKAADYGPLMDRVSLFVELRASSDDECAALAEGLCPNNREAAEALAKFGVGIGSLRSIEKVFGQARGLANGGPITADLIRKAIFMVTGKV